MDDSNEHLNSLTPEETAIEYERRLSEELASYHKSLEEEFMLLSNDDPSIALAAKKRIVEHVPSAATTIQMLLVHGESESVRASLAKWVFEVAMRDGAKEGADNDIDKLIKKLQKQPKSTTTTKESELSDEL